MFTLSILKILDNTLGRPLCFLCHLFTCPKKLSLERPNSVLIIKPTEEGTTIEAIPAIFKLKKLVGWENIFFLVLKSKGEILEATNLIKKENILSIDDSSFLRLIKSSIKITKVIHRLKLDACLDFEGLSNFSLVIAYLTKCPVRIGFYADRPRYKPRKRILTNKILYKPTLHISQQFLMLVGVLENLLSKDTVFEGKIPPLPKEFPSIEFGAKEESFKDISALLNITGQYRCLILVHPHPCDILSQRRWPLNNYANLIKSLLKATPSKIALIGTKEERAISDRIVSKVPAEDSLRIVSLVGKTSLRELLFLLKRADLLITSDSGPAHFAALFKTRTVVLFGPETPLIYAPVNPNALVIKSSLKCSPCFSAFNNRISSCKNNLCMQNISVDRVMEASLKLLRES